MKYEIPTHLSVSEKWRVVSRLQLSVINHHPHWRHAISNAVGSHLRIFCVGCVRDKDNHFLYLHILGNEARSHAFRFPFPSKIVSDLELILNLRAEDTYICFFADISETKYFDSEKTMWRSGVFWARIYLSEAKLCSQCSIIYVIFSDIHLTFTYHIHFW